MEGYRWKNEWADEESKGEQDLEHTGSSEASHLGKVVSGEVASADGTKTWTYDKEAYFRENPGSREATLAHAKNKAAKRKDQSDRANGREMKEARPNHYSEDQHASFYCFYEPCASKSKSFKLKADLERHIASRHKRASTQLIDCEWPGCHRRGDYGFFRKDKMLQHMRDVHKDPLQATKRRESTATEDTTEQESE